VAFCDATEARRFQEQGDLASLQVVTVVLEGAEALLLRTLSKVPDRIRCLRVVGSRYL
jgi:hypothetical protein